jgi:hypothetical protein
MFISMIGMARLPGAGHLETVSPSQHQIIQRFGFDKDLLLSGRLPCWSHFVVLSKKAGRLAEVALMIRQGQGP